MEYELRRPPPAGNFPYQATPFVGRENELQDIVQLLLDPSCSLLTLVGPGGTGKTRLAIEAARKQTAAFANGVYFVDLQPLLLVDSVISAIAEGLEFPLTGQETALEQLLGYLEGKEMLLILDNFEHVLMAAEDIAELLQALPALKLLVTSREGLKLQEEWLYPLEGLSYPEVHEEGELAAYSAIQLFVERARRVRPKFSLAKEAEGVVHICQLVSGIPLAIELAAAWTRTLRTNDIASEIDRNLSFLATELRNVPERHRSMQAVVTQSWEQLSSAERSVFMGLSVFRGGFSHEAAEAVCDASLQLLASLADRSLLRRGLDERFHIHEHLRRFASDRLAQSSHGPDRTKDLHCEFYAQFLHKRLPGLSGGRQRQSLIEIETELDNVRAAWHWAVDNRKIAEMQKAAHVLSGFFQFKGRYLEALKMGQGGIEALDSVEKDRQTERALVLILIDLAWVLIRTGHIEQAEEMVERCQKVYLRLGIPPLEGMATDPLLHAGTIASIKGNYEEAIELGHQARKLNETHNHLGNQAFAYYVLAEATLALGDYESAQKYAQQAYVITQETQDLWFMAYCLNDLGLVASAQGEYPTARGHFEASYALRKSFGDPEGMAVALNYLGEIALSEGRYVDAQDSFQRSLSLYQDLGDKGGLAKAHRSLGMTAASQANGERARQHYHTALQIAASIHFTPLILCLLADIGILLLPTESAELSKAQSGESGVIHGAEFLALAAEHEASNHETRELATETLNKYQFLLPADVFSSAVQEGRRSDLNAAVMSALALLTVDFKSPAKSEADDPAIPRPSQPLTQPLVDPLTSRELQVLRLIADGLTNREIADQLVLSVGTVKYYTSQIYSKLQVSSRTKAVARARELDLLPKTSGNRSL